MGEKKRARKDEAVGRDCHPASAFSYSKHWERQRKERRKTNRSCQMTSPVDERISKHVLLFHALFLLTLLFIHDPPAFMNLVVIKKHKWPK